MATLTGPQIEQLQELILDAFSQKQFEELLLVKLDIHLDQVIPTGLDWRAAAREAILAAGREGWTADLLRAIAEARPRRADIQILVEQLLPLVEHVAPTMAAVELPTPVPQPPTPMQVEPTGTTESEPTLAPTKTPLAASTDTPGVVAQQSSVPDGATWMDVPAGESLMGSAGSDADAQPDEKPQHTVFILIVAPGILGFWRWNNHYDLGDGIGLEL